VTHLITGTILWQTSKGYLFKAQTLSVRWRICNRTVTDTDTDTGLFHWDFRWVLNSGTSFAGPLAPASLRATHPNPSSPSPIFPPLPSPPSPVVPPLQSPPSHYLPHPSLLLEIGPLKSSYEIWGIVVISRSRVWGRAPKSNLVHFSFKIWHMVATILISTDQIW